MKTFSDELQTKTKQSQNVLVFIFRYGISGGSGQETRKWGGERGFKAVGVCVWDNRTHVILKWKRDPGRKL